MKLSEKNQNTEGEELETPPTSVFTGCPGKKMQGYKWITGCALLVLFNSFLSNKGKGY